MLVVLEHTRIIRSGHQLDFVVFVERDQFFTGDFQAFEQGAGFFDLFADDRIGLAQGFDGAQGDITGIADGDSNNG